MFTGLIQDVGKVVSLQLSKRSATLVVGTRLPVRSMELGASIAVNGACLTVTKKGKDRFAVERLTGNLKAHESRDTRNRQFGQSRTALATGDGLGGHLVTGHIDGVAVVESMESQGEFTFFTFRIPAQLRSFLVSKGSIAVDGVSLTINKCSRKGFSVAIIPFTLEHTNLRARRVGDKVNIETDLIGKYVQKLVKAQK